MTVLRAFEVGIVYIEKRFSLELLMVLILIAAALWYAFANENCLDKINFSFPLPGAVIILSFCLLSALMTPLIYTGDATEKLEFVFMQVFYVYRVENVIFFDFILLLTFDLIYLLGWIYKKGFSRSHIKALGLTSALGLVLLIIVIYNGINNGTTSYTTLSAISNLKNSTAQYYGLQMAENTYRLMQENRDVDVMPMAVAPECLYPFEAEDWKSGTVLYYDKDSVIYESEPYIFDR